MLPTNFHPASRVWIYQGNRPLTPAETGELEAMMAHFTQTWTSHGAKVKGYAALFYGQFIVLMADETQAGVSGCSTDSSVHLIKEAEQRFGLSFFDRLNLAFLIDEKVRLVPLSGLIEAIKEGIVDADTIYFNNIVSSKQELETRWLIPVGESWLAKKLPAEVAHLVERQLPKL